MNRRRFIQAAAAGLFLPAVALAGLLMQTTRLSAPSSGGGGDDPTTQPLVQDGDITYLGLYNIPVVSDDFAYTTGGLFVEGDQLWLAGHRTAGQTVGRLTLPGSFGGTATLQVSPVSVPGSTGADQTPQIAGILAWNERLLIQKVSTYQNNGSSGRNNFIVANSPTDISDFESPVAMDEDETGSTYGYLGLVYAQFTNGYMGIIPEEWRSLFGYPAAAGNGVMSINAQGTNGPSFYGFDPDAVAVTTPFPSKEFLAYPWEDHPIYADPRSQNTVFTLADQTVGGMAFPSGTSSVLFFMRHGTGPYSYKENPPDDPCDPNDGGEQAYPYVVNVLAYDANDIVDGELESWEKQPYDIWELPSPPGGWGCANVWSGSFTYEHETRRIYGVVNAFDNPEVYVWQIDEPEDLGE